jgi:succinate dehydrogenase / fumarate reductase membrane anchor subunit
MDLISPLKRVVGLGTAKGASEHWWLQRVSAVALIPLGLWFAFSLLALPSFDHGTVVEWMGEPLTAILLTLTIIAIGYHSSLGVQVVVEDYVGKGWKAVAIVASTLAHVGLSVAAIFAVLKVAFGS